jgi:hypothetical protein
MSVLTFIISKWQCKSNAAIVTGGLILILWGKGSSTDRMTAHQLDCQYYNALLIDERWHCQLDHMHVPS